MKQLVQFAAIVAVFSVADAFSKYGRTCKDIGCTSNQVCVIQEDPCTPYSKPNSCGKYPTCRKVSSAAATCSSYICPPTMSCRMDRGVPKCYASTAKGNKQGHVGSPTYPQQARQNPNYPQHSNYPNFGVYPRYQVATSYGQTTSRPNVYYPGQHGNGGGYQGGAIGSGYPGQGGYPRQTNGYPTQGYPQQTNYNGHYQTQWNNGYSGQTYPRQGGYSRRNQGGYPNYNQQRYNQKQGEDNSNGVLDTVTNFLKTNFNL